MGVFCAPWLYSAGVFATGTGLTGATLTLGLAGARFLFFSLGNVLPAVFFTGTGGGGIEASAPWCLKASNTARSSGLS